MPENHKNHLAGESSLYLQQHANNPVDWYPWSDAAWEKAKKENKLVLVSIGYSSCHWCHVMEKETFMDEKTAKIMNQYFVCIKVDREERPDIDQVYMTAVQLMTGSGGWPLNCFTLPDGKPFFGGTYFPRNNWQDLLLKLKDFYQHNPEKAVEYAAELAQGLSQSELFPTEKTDKSLSTDVLTEVVATWKNQLDYTAGGPSRTPKFPLPNNYQFLLRYGFTFNDSVILNQVYLTLDKMAFGGIYDQLAGGFARYSTDSVWKVPHFEKMLYDNAQLISLYSSAYKITHNELYKNVVDETIRFLRSNMSDGKGAYYSAIDADSEGEEGKYYVWTKEEIEKINLPPCGNAESKKVFSDYFSINQDGFWEKGNYILFRTQSDEAIAAKHNLTTVQLSTFISECKTMLLKIREKRKPPVTDSKIITSWNALQISALCEAYQAFGIESYRNEAITCAERLKKDVIKSDGFLFHVASENENKIHGFHDDYAFTVSAFIRLYEITFEEDWLLLAKKITEYAFENFYDEKDGFFWFTSNNNSKLIARKKEISDNVIAASNSEMAHALFRLGIYFEENKYTETARNMTASTIQNLKRFPSSYSNWLNLFISLTHPTTEIAITGKDADKERKKLAANFLPDALFCGKDQQNSVLPLLENRFVPGKTLIYVCRNKTCRLPVDNEAEALSLLQSK